MRRVALISDIHGNAAALAVALRPVPVDVDALEGNSPLKTKPRNRNTRLGDAQGARAEGRELADARSQGPPAL